jgi:hypothetical protein
MPTEISILARVAGDTFEPFAASNGATFSKVQIGAVGMDEMYGDAESQNTSNMWYRRVMGTLFACFGVKLGMAKLRARVAYPAGFAWSLLIIVAALLASK